MINMKNRIVLLATVIACIASVATVITSCNKKYDTPPAATDPNITVTHTIKQLKALHTVAGQLDVITTDVVIAGVVIADDKSGNFYKQLYIQDATGGIALQLDATGLYATYPVGRKIYVNCKGLCISDYNLLPQLGIRAIVSGAPSLEGIPSDLIRNYVTGGSLNNAVVPKIVTQASLPTPTLNDDNLATLIQLNNYEFGKGDTTSTYADTSAYKNTKNVTIRECGGSSIIIRTSGYANFAGVRPPKGNGSIRAVYTSFGTTRQLLIRDTTDVQFTGARCNIFEEDFNSYATTGTAPLVIPGWRNIMETGDVPYTLAAFSGSVFPKVSAFGSAALPTTNISTWLISPDINIPTGGAPAFSFTCSRRYTIGTFKVLVSTNYNGGAPASATWTQLVSVPANANNTAAFTPFDLFGPYNFTSYAGQKINIAFRYEVPAGTPSGSVTTYEPDDLKITK
jgi:hypothetical protein